MSKIIRGTKAHVLLQGSTTEARQNNYLPLPGHVKDKKKCKEIKTKRKKQKTTSSTTTKRCHSYQVPKESSMICPRNPQWLLQITTCRCQLLKRGPSQSPSAVLPHVSNSVKYARQGFWVLQPFNLITSLQLNFYMIIFHCYNPNQVASKHEILSKNLKTFEQLLPFQHHVHCTTTFQSQSLQDWNNSLHNPLIILSPLSLRV